MTTTEFRKYVDDKRANGCTVVGGNDVMGSGFVIFNSMAHSLVPSPIIFEFVRLLPSGEMKSISFAMPLGSWKEILIHGLKDAL